MNRHITCFLVYFQAQLATDMSTALTVPCYIPFKVYLTSRGFAVYPEEFDCIYSNHPLVDVAARMGSQYWAFEYKSRSDSTSRGVEQLRSYSSFFDYVVLVTEKVLDHRKNANYWELKHMGAGLWSFDPVSKKCIECSNPVLQSPIRENKKMVAKRFARPYRKQRFRKIIASAVLEGKQLRLS